MSHELISVWLQLPPGNWPPDHYTLLGLNPGETDLTLVEQRVHERMQMLRCYQLTHPEPATEAMNRLAQALVCLTDPRAKQAYDASLLGEPVTVAESAPAPAVTAEATDPLAWLFGPWNPSARPPERSPAEGQTLVDWQTAPPPPRIRPDKDTTEIADADDDTVPEATAWPSAAEVDDTSSPSPTVEPVDSVAEAARLSGASRRGLGTRRALYYRIARTRQLLWAWEQAGIYLNRPTRPVNRPAEATDLLRFMKGIRQLLRTFPPTLGEAGQPGYLVLSLARQHTIVPTLQTLLPSQREALARDWQAGRELLLAQRDFLRQELRSVRRRGPFGQALRWLKTSFRERPGIWLVLVGVLALNLAFKDYTPPDLWLLEGLIFAALIALRVVWWWGSLRLTKMHGLNGLPAARKRPRTKVRRQPNSSGA